MTTKVYTKCGFPKSESEFVRSKNRKDGLHCWCKICFASASRVRNRRPEVVEYHRAYQRDSIARRRESIRDLPKGSKVCSNCEGRKDFREFPISYGTVDCRGSWCLACLSNVVSNKARGRQELLNKAKSKHCSDCGGLFPSFCMDFDHVCGVKLGNISDLLTCSYDLLLAELSKCDVVCACFHRIHSRRVQDPTGNQRLRSFHERVDLIKSEPCSDCGGRFPPVAMDFDHVRGTKFRMVSTMVNYSWERVLSEIEKCELVCANCHRIRTQCRESKVAA